MDIFEFAMKMELDGKTFYENHAASETNADLKTIFESLAEEELRHYRIFKGMKDNPADTSLSDLLSGPSTLTTVKNIFEKMAQAGDRDAFGEDKISVWTEALRIEERAEVFYKEKAAEETDDNRKNLFELIAAEEYNHIQMIDSVLMYLKQPDSFAASAQYRNFRSIEGM